MSVPRSWLSPLTQFTPKIWLMYVVCSILHLIESTSLWQIRKIICMCVCLSVCVFATGLAPLPLDLDTWFFVPALVMTIGQNNIFCFLKKWFFTELCPFLFFSLCIPCNLNWWLWKAPKRYKSDFWHIN